MCKPARSRGRCAGACARDRPDLGADQTQLVAALQLLGDHAAARRVLDAAPPARGFLRRYLDAFSAVMTSDIDAARERAALLAPSDDAERFMASRLERIFARHTSVASVTALDAHDVRGWHFVLSGSLLLHVPADSDTAERRAAHGRYAYVADSPALVLEVVERLEAVLAALDLSGMVAHPLDQIDSRVIGTVIADRQGVHARPTLTPVAPGLVTAWDFEAVLADLRAPFAHHREGQVTFAHALCHGHEQRFTPDVVGFLYDQRRPPFAPTETDEAAMVRAIKDATLPDGALDDLGDVVALAVVAQAMVCSPCSRRAACVSPYGSAGPPQATRSSRCTRPRRAGEAADVNSVGRMAHACAAGHASRHGVDVAEGVVGIGRVGGGAEGGVVGREVGVVVVDVDELLGQRERVAPRAGQRRQREGGHAGWQHDEPLGAASPAFDWILTMTPSSVASLLRLLIVRASRVGSVAKGKSRR